MQNQQKKTGLKDRLGAGYAKLGRNGSVWRWEFTWNDTGRGQNGYDNGFLTSNAAIFERLKTRFIYGVLENANYHLKANYFRVYLIDTEDKTKDELIISLRFDNATENGKEYLTPIFSFSQYAKDELSKASILYLEDVFAEYALKLKNKYIGEKNTVNSLIKQANESVQLTPNANATHTPAQVLTLQERYNDAVSVVFGEDKTKLSFLKFNVAEENNDLIILNAEVAHITSNEDLTKFEDKFLSVLRKIVATIGLNGLEYRFSVPKAPTPQPQIPQADNVAETKKLLEKIQKTTIGGEVKSISNFGFPKKLPEKTPQEVAFLEKLTF